MRKFQQTAEDKEIAKLIEDDLFTGSIPVCDENSAPGTWQI